LRQFVEWIRRKRVRQCAARREEERIGPVESRGRKLLQSGVADSSAEIDSPSGADHRLVVAKQCVPEPARALWRIRNADPWREVVVARVNASIRHRPSQDIVRIPHKDQPIRRLSAGWNCYGKSLEAPKLTAGQKLRYRAGPVVSH